MNQQSKFQLKTKFKLIWTLIGGVIGVSLAAFYFLIWNPPPPPPPPPENSCPVGNFPPPSDPKYGIRLNWEDMAKLKDTFYSNISTLSRMSAVPMYLKFKNEGSSGGRMGKCYVQAILNSLPPDSNFVCYQFGKDNLGQAVIVFIGGKNNPTDPANPLPDKLIYRTGTESQAFCPTFCPAR